MSKVKGHRAVIGYLVYMLARKILRRQVTKAGQAATEKGRRATRRARETNGRAEVAMAWIRNGASAAPRTIGGALASRPYVIAAIRDPEFQLGLSRAAAAGRGALDQLRSENPRDALHMLATDEGVQRRLGTALQEVDEALERVGVQAAKKRRRRGRLFLLVGAVLAAAAGVVIAKRMRAGEEEIEFEAEISTDPEGTPPAA